MRSAVFLGFWSGWVFSSDSIEELRIDFGQTQLDLNSVSQRFEFANIFESSNECNSELFEDVSWKLYESSLKLTELEEEGKIDSDYYKFLKERHNMNQVYFYSEYKSYYENCDNSSNIVLFFFNSQEPDIAQKQGSNLDVVVEEVEDIIVLPMDYNSSKNLNYFYEHYNVSELPTIVVNYEEVFEGVTSSDEIINFIEK